MNTPGFTAETSLYKTSRHYRLSILGPGDLPPTQTIVPADLGPQDQEACNTCLETCAETAVACSAVWAGVGGFTCFWCPPCCVAAGVGLAGCAAAAASCEAICHLPGGSKCCPTFCRLGKCCGRGEECVDDYDRGGPGARAGCCPRGQSVCGGKCCLPGDKCCGDACCPAGFNCQQGVCCPPDKPAVCNGICCAGPCDQNGTCCESPGYMCGGKCCFGECCNGQCCDLGQHCHPTLGICCSNICGPSCCPEGQFCLNPTLGTCGQCAPGEHACFGEPRCCPDGSNCCPGGICCWGSGCCRRPDGTWGCCPLPK